MEKELFSPALHFLNFLPKAISTNVAELPQQIEAAITVRRTFKLT
jgi:hypothetical protein